MHTADVVIVGAGPTGLTLSIDLARRGVAVQVLDAKPEDFFTGSRGNGLQPRTLEVFDDLGVVDKILETGEVYPPMRILIGRVPVFKARLSKPTAPSPAVPYPVAIVQPQWRTEQILRERLAEFGVKVHYSTEATAFTQDDDGVTITTGSGETIRARYLVGADGGRSIVRKTLGIGFIGETRETQRLVLGDIKAAGLRRDAWQVWVSPLRKKKMRASIWPVPGTAYLRMTAPIAEGETADLTLAGFQRLLTERTGRRDLTVTELAAPSEYRVNIRLAERYRVGRVFIAGDAAHVHSPAGSQGLNTGVQDAYNLGWKLARVLAGAPESLLDTYEAERLPIARRALGLSTEMLDKKKLKDDETHQLDLSYRGGSLAVGARGGDRAPDAPCTTADGQPTRLFDVFRGSQPTLLCFGTTPAPAGVPSYQIGSDLVDTDGHIRDAYGDTGYVLVRPDGYIGIDAAGMEEVTDYLTRI